MGSAAAIGSVVGERYEIVSILGTGSMAHVYRARRDDGADVAIKVLKQKILNPQAATERLFREAQVITRLKHPGCVRLLDWGVDKGRPYVVLELMVGEALNETLRRVKTIPLQRAVQIMMAVCDVLVAAHDLGVVHRDLKPGNIMLLEHAAANPVRVLDFGLARLGPKQSPDDTQPKELTRPGSTLGTPSYMAPEQVRGSHVDGRADIYACGVILYELIAGQLPIVGETAIDTMLKQATDPPRPILEVAPDLDPAFAKLIMRCLEKAPEARYATAVDLRHELERFANRISFPDTTTRYVRDDMSLEEKTSRHLRPVVGGTAPSVGKGTLLKPTLPPPKRSSAKRPPPPKRATTQRPALPTPTRPKPAPRTIRIESPEHFESSALVAEPQTRTAKVRMRTESATNVQPRDRESDADTTRRHARPDSPAQPPSAQPAATPGPGLSPRLMPIPSHPEIEVMHVHGEVTALTALPEPDLSEMEVTIPAHSTGQASPIRIHHEFDRTFRAAAMKTTSNREHMVAAGNGPQQDRGAATEAGDSATQLIEQARRRVSAKPEAPRSVRLDVAHVQPPPIHPRPDISPLEVRIPSVPPPRNGPAMGSPSPSVRPPNPSFPPRPMLPSMQGPTTNRSGLAEVLSGIPNDERKWLLAAAVLGAVMALGIAVWLLL